MARICNKWISKSDVRIREKLGIATWFKVKLQVLEKVFLQSRENSF